MTAGRTQERRNRPLDALHFWLDVLRCFYVRPIAWVALFISAAFLTYGGGAVMFWFHAIVRGEAGPAIPNAHHWLLDSTLGFVALTPVLGLILPLAVWYAGGAAGQPHARARLWVYVGATATLFTLFTGPGPLLHNAIAGAGTPLADLATRIFGEGGAVAADTAHVHANSPVEEGLLQLCVGLPVYVTCTWLSLWFVRLSVRASRRKTAPAQKKDLCSTRGRAS